MNDPSQVLKYAGLALAVMRLALDNWADEAALFANLKKLVNVVFAEDDDDSDDVTQVDQQIPAVLAVAAVINKGYPGTDIEVLKSGLDNMREYPRDIVRGIGGALELMDLQSDPGSLKELALGVWWLMDLSRSAEAAALQIDRDMESEAGGAS